MVSTLRVHRRAVAVTKLCYVKSLLRESFNAIYLLLFMYAVVVAEVIRQSLEPSIYAPFVYFLLVGLVICNYPTLSKNIDVKGDTMVLSHLDFARIKATVRSMLDTFAEGDEKRVHSYLEHLRFTEQVHFSGHLVYRDKPGETYSGEFANKSIFEPLMYGTLFKIVSYAHTDRAEGHYRFTLPSSMQRYIVAYYPSMVTIMPLVFDKEQLDTIRPGLHTMVNTLALLEYSDEKISIMTSQFLNGAHETTEFVVLPETLV